MKAPIGKILLTVEVDAYTDEDGELAMETGAGWRTGNSHEDRG